MDTNDQGYVCRTELRSHVAAKTTGKAGSALIAAILLLRLFTGWHSLVVPADALALGLFVAMSAIPRVAAWTGTPFEATLLWKAQCFAFGAVALFLTPAAAFPSSLYADALSSVLMVMMTLATFTEFCLGRVAYVVLVKASGLPG